MPFKTGFVVFYIFVAFIFLPYHTLVSKMHWRAAYYFIYWFVHLLASNLNPHTRRENLWPLQGGNGI